MDKLPVFMSIDEWQNVVNILADHPYKQVKGPIEIITSQVSQLVQARQTMVNGAGGQDAERADA